jgi:prepilin-type N-terminal cleavage/methylation domain-containing protein
MRIWQDTVERTLAARRRRLPIEAGSAFTLMELLVVMAIIAILAGLTVVIIPAVQEKRARSVAGTIYKDARRAVEVYHAELNTYPPDNPGRPDRPQLLYELTGTAAQTQPQADGTETVIRYNVRPLQGNGFTPAEVDSNFKRKGFRNAGEDGAFGKDYLPGLASKFYAQDPADPLPTDRRPFYLVVPVKGPGGDFNPLRYNSSNPTNSPGSYDLWIEIAPRGKTIRIGNQ